MLYFQEGAAAGEAPALFKAALNMWWSQVFKMSTRIPQKIAFGEQTSQQGSWNWMILRSLQPKPFCGSVNYRKLLIAMMCREFSAAETNCLETIILS